MAFSSRALRIPTEGSRIQLLKIVGASLRRCWQVSPWIIEVVHNRLPCPINHARVVRGPVGVLDRLFISDSPSTHHDANCQREAPVTISLVACEDEGRIHATLGMH